MHEVRQKIDIDELKQYIAECSTETKIYFGADSERINVDGKWVVDYLLLVAVHIDAKHGAKVFVEVQREPDYDKNLDRPRLRLMNEVYKVSELYLKMHEFLEDKVVELHLDLNPLQQHGSSCVISEAIGYVKGVCGIDPKVKPDAWCASIAADRAKSFK
jgi:predicted RNase H-related nuclease YkuK (DUF458 family)